METKLSTGAVPLEEEFCRTYTAYLNDPLDLLSAPTPKMNYTA
jgi:hypothetical protein